jgi:hypothetical protein
MVISIDLHITLQRSFLTSFNNIYMTEFCDYNSVEYNYDTDTTRMVCEASFQITFKTPSLSASLAQNILACDSYL